MGGGLLLRRDSLIAAADRAGFTGSALARFASGSAANLPCLRTGCDPCHRGVRVDVRGARRRSTGSALATPFADGLGGDDQSFIGFSGCRFFDGQRGLPSAEGGSLDATVFALGAGAAVALGVVMMFVYQPTPIWGTRDDLALAEEHAALIGQPRIDFGVHARGSSFVLLTMMLLLLGGLLLIVSSWAALALAVLILLLMGSLFVRVSIDGSAVEERFLVLRVAGFLPVAKYRLAELHAVEAVPSDPWQQGGPGLRRHAGYWQFIVRKGTALRLDFGPRAGLLIGTRDEEQVAELIAYLRASQE